MVRKQKNRNHWTLPIAYAGRRSEIHIWLNEDKSSIDFGRYQIYRGAVVKMADTFEEAVKTAQELAHGEAL